jgi:arylsulfatase A-like enzyme
MPDPPVGNWTDLFRQYANPKRPDAAVGEMNPRVVRRARAGYYGHISHIDHQINRFLEILNEYRLGANTVICFVSDHGEMLGDHHMFRKGYPNEGSARVPLILKVPGDNRVGRNRVVDAPVELRDVMPTLLDCAGLPVPESVEGRSVLPLARGESVDWRAYLHGEHTVFGQSLQWLTDGHEKYVWFSGTGTEQLFDLDTDPHETCDLARESRNVERLAEWRQRLLAELTGREEGFVENGRLVPGKPVKPCLSLVTSR